MAENVFILGAGASAESGAPLMKDFLDTAEDLLRANAFRGIGERERIEKVFQVISELQAVYAKSYLDLNNIEHLFGALELARIVSKLGKRSNEEIAELRDALVLLIVKTLEKSINFPFNQAHIGPTPSYESLAKLVKDQSFGRTSIITFNYDCALELAFYTNGSNVDYGLGPQEINRLKVLKLHGSINWGECKTCGEVIPYDVGSWLAGGRVPFIDSKSVTLELSIRLKELESKHKCQKGQGEIRQLPMLVPPTWNKTEYHGSLSRVWGDAAKELSEAKNVYVLGYSLPETDSFFRYLFALGTMSDTRIRRFWVFNPDDSNGIKGRYLGLIGEGIRERFEYIPMKFSQAIAELKSRGS